MAKFCRMTALLLCGSALMTSQVRAETPATATVVEAGVATALDSAFEAAVLGDLVPLQRALAQTTDEDLRTVLRARLAIARNDLTVLRDPALMRLAEGSDPERRRGALGVLTWGAMAQEDYAEAARAGRLYAAALAGIGDTELIENLDRGWRVAALIADQPRQVLDGPIVEGSIAARVDRVGLPRIDVAINGQMQEAVFDTGAAFTVLSTETARRLGVTILEGDAAVGNGVNTTVAVRVGIAERLEIAGVRFRNVVCLIVDDSQLTFPLPGGYDIKAIIGMPVMRAIGRLRMESERLTVLPAAAPAGPPNLHATGNSVYADVSLDGRTFPLLLDTGANQTSLTALYAQAVPAAVAGLETRRVAAASAGGTREQQVANWPNVPVGVSGRILTLPAVSVALPAEGAPSGLRYGILGSDVLRRFQSYTIDFNAMRLELGEPVAG